MVERDDPSPHLYTEFPEGSPSDLPNDHLHPAIEVEAADGAAELVGRAARWDGSRSTTRRSRCGRRSATAKWSTACAVLAPAKLTKTLDELECIRQAQAINERAMRTRARRRAAGRARDRSLGRVPARDRRARRDVEHRRPGVPGHAARRSPTGPFSVTGDPVFPLPTRRRELASGDVLWIDTGINLNGYASDFGATWIVGGEPDERAHAQFDEWRAIVDRVLDGHEARRDRRRPRARARPNATAAGRGSRTSTSRTGSAPTAPRCRSSAPTAATSSTRRSCSQPGMVLVFEPVVWEDGHCGHRSEEIVAITEDGYLWLSSRAELDGVGT